MNPNDLRNSRYADLAGATRIEQLPIHVMGVGSVGRSLAIALATMGARNVTLFDPDVVEAVNTGTQGFSPMLIGQPKVEATAISMQHCNPDCAVVENQARRPISQPGPCDVLFVCVDNMTSRINIGCHVHSQPKGLLVDTRIGLLDARIIGDTPPLNVWKSTLFSEAEMERVPCALQITHFTALLATGWALAAMFNWFRDGDEYKPMDILHNTMDFSIIHEPQPSKRLRSDYFGGCFPFRQLLADGADRDPHATFDLPLPAGDRVGSELLSQHPDTVQATAQAANRSICERDEL